MQTRSGFHLAFSASFYLSLLLLTRYKFLFGSTWPEQLFQSPHAHGADHRELLHCGIVLGYGTLLCLFCGLFKNFGLTLLHCGMRQVQAIVELCWGTSHCAYFLQLVQKTFGSPCLLYYRPNSSQGTGTVGCLYPARSIIRSPQVCLEDEVHTTSFCRNKSSSSRGATTTHTHRLWQKVRKREREKKREKMSENEERNKKGRKNLLLVLQNA